MDVRLSAEQQALRDSVVQVVGRLGPHTVAELGDGERSAKLDAAVAASGGANCVPGVTAESRGPQRWRWRSSPRSSAAAWPTPRS